MAGVGVAPGGALVGERGHVQGVAAWDDFQSFGRDADGGSVCYGLRSGDWANDAHRSYATMLAQQGRTVQVGVSWKDNPPGFDGGAVYGLEQQRGDQWVKRLFSLMDYQGPIPNLPGRHDLRGVIRSVVHVDLDFRYGWDGIDGGGFDFPPDTTWFVDGRLSRYGAAKASFRQGLAANGLTARCR